MSDLVKKKAMSKKIVRSLLISAPCGLTLHELEKDYLSVANEKLPYRMFGCTDVLEFVKTLPDIVHIQYKQRQMRLYGIADNSTKHLKDMIDHQRKPKKYTGLKKTNTPPRRPNSNSRCMSAIYLPSYVQRNISKVLQSNNSGISLSDFPNLYKQANGISINSERFGFSQLSDLFMSIPSVAKLEFGRKDREGNNLYVYSRNPCEINDKSSKINSEDSVAESIKKITAKIRENLNNSKDKEESTEIQKQKKETENILSSADKNTAKSVIPVQKESNPAPKAELHIPVLPSCQILKREILEILSEESKVTWSVRIPALYKKKFGKEMKLKELGYCSLIEFLSTLSDEIRIKRPNAKGDWLLSKRSQDINKKESPPQSIIFGLNEGLEVTKMEVKELLIKSKDGIELSEMLHVYEKVYKHKLHFDEYGMSSILQFITLIKGVCIYDKNGKLFVTLTESEKQIFPEHFRNQNTLPQGVVDAVGSKGSYISPMLPTPSEDDQYIDIFVSDVITPGDFAIQIYGKHTTGALNKLMDDLERFYCSPESERYKVPSCMIAIGQICAAIFLEDLNWHRAVIIRLNEAGYVDVLYVDYGSVATVAGASLRLLKSCFLQLPSQMMSARLAHIQPKNLTSWTRSSRDFMLDMCRDRPLIAQVTRIENRVLSLCLCDTSKPDSDLHINDMLVKNKHAVFFPDDIPEEQTIALKEFLLGEMVSETAKNVPIPKPIPCTEPNLKENISACGTSMEKGEKHLKVQRRFIKPYRVCDKYTFHIINYEGNALVTSAEISLMFQNSTDVLVPMLMVKNLKFSELVLGNDEKHKGLFRELLHYKVPGAVDMVCLYCLEDIPAITFGLGHLQQNELNIEFKRIMRDFNPDADYWSETNAQDICDNQSDASIKTSLLDKRKLLLEELANQSTPAAVEEIENIERELISIGEKFLNNPGACCKEMNVENPNANMIHNLMENQYSAQTPTEKQNDKKASGGLGEPGKNPPCYAECADVVPKAIFPSRSLTIPTEQTGLESSAPEKACDISVSSSSFVPMFSKPAQTQVAEVNPFVQDQALNNSNFLEDLSEIPGAHIPHNVVDFSIPTRTTVPRQSGNLSFNESQSYTSQNRSRINPQIHVHQQGPSRESNESLYFSRSNFSLIPRDAHTHDLGYITLTPGLINRPGTIPPRPQQWQCVPVAQQQMPNPAFTQQPQIPPLYYESISVPTSRLQESQYMLSPENRSINLQGQQCIYPVGGLSIINPLQQPAAHQYVMQ